MNKVIAIIVVVVLLALGGYFFLANKPTAPSSPQDQPAQQLQQAGVDLEKLMQQYQTTPPTQE